MADELDQGSAYLALLKAREERERHELQDLQEKVRGSHAPTDTMRGPRQAPPLPLPPTSEEPQA